jgi:hypothetical protein
MPSIVTGKTRKPARPYYGPYRILSVTPTNVEARLVDKLDADSIFAAASCVRPCYPEISDILWTGRQRSRRRLCRRPEDAAEPIEDHETGSSGTQPVRTVGPITRSMTQSSH